MLVFLGKCLLEIFLNFIFCILDGITLVSMIIIHSSVADSTNASLLSKIVTDLGSLM